MFTTKLRKKERRLIRQVAKMQLLSISALLKNETETDLTLWSIENEIEEDSLRIDLEKTQATFASIYRHPGTFCNLDADNISIMKTLLFKYFDSPEYSISRKRIWKKLKFASFVPGCLPMPN